MKNFHLLLAGLITTGIASADTTLIYNNQKGQQSSSIHLTDGKVKMTHTTQANTAIVFDAGSTSFTLIDHDRKTYMKFGPKEIAALSDVSNMMDKMINEQLAQIPEAQRSQMRGMIESMIKNQMPKQAPKPEYHKSGQTTSHNGFDCEVVLKQVQDQKAGTFCVTDYHKLGISTAEYQAINGFMKVAEKMASQFGQDQSMNFDAIGQVVPVFFDMEFDQGVLSSVKNEDLPSSTFLVPEGYQQQSLPEQMF